MRKFLIAALFSSACSSAPLMPSAPAAAIPPRPLPLVLSGQSNALPDHLGDPLRASYTPGVVNVSQGATAIRAWAPDGSLWRELEPQLHQPLQAFVWWQGESDAVEGGEHYSDDLRSLVARVRAANANPTLLVVLVKIIPYTPAPPLHDTSLVREAEEAFAGTDAHSLIVRVDDLPSDGGNHLVSSAYPAVAARVVEAITGR